jgi:catechol 2,3-dioxygenase-like lactoylglutathione lyase family enzyme
MKRLHLNLSVADLDQSVRFYSTLFEAEPIVLEADYAKWMLDDPRVNFSISTHGSTTGVDHLGIQVDSPQELEQIADRLAEAGQRVLDRGEAHCCYAHSTKAWVRDPQGLPWETFFTFGRETTYGEDRPVGLTGMVPSESGCCGCSTACCAEEVTA